MIVGARFQRAFLFTTWLYSFLLWLYIVIRLITDPTLMFEPFVYAVPWIKFWELGAFSFVFSFVCMLAYLTFWWPFNGDGERRKV